MGPSCPSCKRSDFSLKALRSVHPFPGEFSPSQIHCPTCGAALRITATSRIVAASLVVVFPVLMILIAGSLTALVEWQLLGLMVVALAGYYFAIWPVVVRLKPWTPFQYWLPNSRLVGYSVYLFFPIAIIALLLYAAFKFELGM